MIFLEVYRDGVWRKVALAAAVAVPGVALAVFSTGAYGYYWGGIMSPVALSLAPLVLVPFLSPSFVRAERSARADVTQTEV